MGIFKKIFKGIGSVFKKIGKFIKKGFGKLGKVMNKLGIVGQIGMMFITGGIANMAFSGLQTLGQGFMSGLASKAATNGLAKVAHGVLTGAAKIANVPLKAIGSITEQVVGTVTDVVKSMGSVVGGQGVTAAQGVTFAPGANQFDKILSNVAGRFDAGIKSVGGALGDAGKFSKDVVTGNYNPQHETYTVGSGADAREVTRETNYNKQNEMDWKNSPEYAKTQEFIQKQREIGGVGVEIVGPRGEQAFSEFKGHEIDWDQPDALDNFYEQYGFTSNPDSPYVKNYTDAMTEFIAEGGFKDGMTELDFAKAYQQYTQNNPTTFNLPYDATSGEGGFIKTSMETPVDAVNIETRPDTVVGSSPTDTRSWMTKASQEAFSGDRFARIGEGAVQSELISLMSPPEELQGYNPSGYLTARSQTPQLVGEVSRQANLLDPIQDFSGQGQMEMAPASSDYSEWDSFFDETLGFNNFAASRNKPFYA